MSAPFRVLFRWAREALENLGSLIPNRSVVVYSRDTGQWEVRPLTPEDVGAAPAVHTHPLATTTTAGFLSPQDKQKLDNLTSGSGPAFSAVKVGTQTLQATETNKTLELVAGANVVLAPDVTNRRVVISATGGGGGGGGGGGYATVVAGSTTMMADAGEPLVFQGSGPVQVSGDASTDTVTIGLTMGSGSGLDADTVDGKHASEFAPVEHLHSEYAPVTHTHPEYAPVSHTHPEYAPISHTHATATTSQAGFLSAADKQKLDTIQAGAEVNQNAYSSVKVGTTTIPATSKTDTLELVAGSNVTLVPDATARKVTISATGGSTSPSFAKVRVGTTDIEASVPGDTVSIEGLGEAQVTPDTTNKKVQLYVPSRAAFSRVRVGETDVQASSPLDVVELAAGSNVTLTPDTSAKRVTIAASQPAISQVKVGSQTFQAAVANALLELVASGAITLNLDTATGRVTIGINQGPGSGLDADTLDGYHAGNASGRIPISNGTVNTNLNADMLDGYHASQFVTSGTLSAYWQRGGNAGYVIYVQGTAPGGASIGDVWIDTSQTA